MRTITFSYADMRGVDQQKFRDGLRAELAGRTAVERVSDANLDLILRHEPCITAVYRISNPRWAFEAGRQYGRQIKKGTAYGAKP